MMAQLTKETTTPDTETEQAQAATPAAGVVHVTHLAGDNVSLDHTPTQTVRDYLAQADITPGHGEVVTVNGQPADLDSPVEPNSVVVVAGAVRNG